MKDPFDDHMAHDAPAYQLDGQNCSREAFYAVACDPTRHVVVQACAGAGKTWMLVSRIVRALLQGTAAHEILAITFTKKAAGEMRSRLADWLREFAVADDAQLRQELVNRGISNQIAAKSSPNMREKLSNLYYLLISDGRGVQIRTFHSWFAALLRNAPLCVLEELQLPAQYSLLEDDSEAVALVWPRLYDLFEKDEALQAVYRASVQYTGRFNTEKALTAALAKRVEFELADAGGAHSVVARSIQRFGQVFTEFAGLDQPLEMLTTNRDHRQKLRDAAMHLGRAPQPSFSAKGVELEAALGNADYRAVFAALLTLKNEPRKFSDKIVGIDAVRVAQDLCVRVQLAMVQHEAWLHQQRMAQLLRALTSCLRSLKQERGWVDMGDIERAAYHLLSDPVLSGWVQQRLDANTRQILVDEFQDTNPLQWQALQAWLSGYAGSGAGQVPSVFIVGDPKQSIYRFRRAEPQVFVAATTFVRDALGGAVLSCDHTRRNAQAVVAATNGVMLHAVQHGYEGFRRHTTESAEPGAVLRLQQVLRPDKPAFELVSTWRDSLTEPRVEVEDKLHTLECRQAAQWVVQHLAAGIQLTDSKAYRPLRASDIMVLSRKRDRLQRMREALQAVGVASVLTEKTKLMDHCEVQDMVALVDAVVSPSNDLALARALKSPMFSLHDDDLSTIAHIAKKESLSWWYVLSKTELLAQNLQGLCLYLLKIQAWFNQLPPHDALSAVYHHHQVIERFMAAAPADMRTSVAANLQALLAASLDAGGGRFTTPYTWVRALKANQVPAPGNGSANDKAVSLLTVHGAKGLEAHTVLMLDTDAPPEKSRTMDVLIDWPAAQPAPVLFAFLASESLAPRSVQDALQAEQAARAREETNALYVAATRAKNTLVISSCQPHVVDPNSPWQRFAQLPEVLVAHVDLQISVLPAVAIAAPDAITSTENFYLLKMPEVSVFIDKPAINNIANSPPKAADDSSRIGQAMHRLLELYTPGLALHTLAQAVGIQFQLTPAQAQLALDAAQRITQGEAAWVWDSTQIDWQANEVELVTAGTTQRVDRLVRHASTQTWWVLDYKSAFSPERDTALQQQLASYHAAVQAANPSDAVRSAFITGQGKLVVSP